MTTEDERFDGGPTLVRTDGATSGPSLRRGRWAATLSLLGLVLSWTFGILFLTSGGIYAPLSDVSSLVYKLPLVVVAWVLYRIYRPAAPTGSLVVLVLGLSGIAVSAVSGLGLAVNDVGIPLGGADAFLAGQRVGSLVIGVWLLAVSGRELREGALGRRVAAAGVVAGSGMVLLQSSLLVGGVAHPGFRIGSVVQLLGTVLWTVWLVRRFRSARVASRSEATGDPATAE